MNNLRKKELERDLILAVREYGISMVLFRNLVGSTIGINVTDMECLGLLFHQGIATPTELAKHTGLTSGSTTAMLDRLEKARLITRKPNPNDRRGILITINKIGAKKIAPLFIGVRKGQDELVEGYSEKDVQVLLDFFSKFTDIYELHRKKLIQNAKPEK